MIKNDNELNEWEDKKVETNKTNKENSGNADN